MFGKIDYGSFVFELLNVIGMLVPIHFNQIFHLNVCHTVKLNLDSKHTGP